MWRRWRRRGMMRRREKVTQVRKQNWLHKCEFFLSAGLLVSSKMASLESGGERVSFSPLVPNWQPETVNVESRSRCFFTTLSFLLLCPLSIAFQGSCWGFFVSFCFVLSSRLVHWNDRSANKCCCHPGITWSPLSNGHGSFHSLAALEIICAVSWMVFRFLEWKSKSATFPTALALSRQDHSSALHQEQTLDFARSCTRRTTLTTSSRWIGLQPARCAF